MKRWLLLTLIATCAGANAAAGAVLRGTLQLPAVAPGGASFNAYPGRASAMPGMHDSPRGQVTDAVVYLETIPPAAESTLALRPAPHPQLAQHDQQFAPRVVVVAVGDTVDFPNQDPIYHNVFSVSPTKRFDLGKYPRGHSKSVRFDRAGLVNVYCDIHSDMAAFVLVLPHHGYVRPAADGAFEFPDLPAGRYTLKVWHPDFGKLSRDVVLGDRRGAPVEIRY